MGEKFTKEEVEKAIEQADANIGFEEADIPLEKENNNVKVLRKDLASERYRRPKNLG